MKSRLQLDGHRAKTKITKAMYRKSHRHKCKPSSGSNRRRKQMSRDMTKPTKWVYTQRRLRSAWASARFDQSLRCLHEETFGPKLPIERTAKTLIKLGGCPGWSESSLGAHSFCLILSYRGSDNDLRFKRYEITKKQGNRLSLFSRGDHTIEADYTNIKSMLDIHMKIPRSEELKRHAKTNNITSTLVRSVAKSTEDTPKRGAKETYKNKQHDQHLSTVSGKISWRYPVARS